MNKSGFEFRFLCGVGLLENLVESGNVMTRTYSHLRLKLTICAVIFTQLACGAMTAQLPATPTATDEIITSYVQNMPSIATKTPQKIIIVGDDTTWNIREGAGLDYPVVGIAHGGQEFVKLDVVGAWVQVPSGWICSRAFGGSGDCK